MVLDFAENFMGTHQDEVQAVHWHHEQVTVHPIYPIVDAEDARRP